MKIHSPLPALAFPHDFDSLTIEDCPTDGSAVEVSIEDYISDQTILSVELTPNAQGKVVLYDLSSLLLDYLESQMPNEAYAAQNGAPFFLCIKVKAGGTEIGSAALIPCRHRLSFPASELLSTRFLTLTSASEGPLPVPQGSATEQPLSFVEESGGETTAEELPITIFAAFAPIAASSASASVGIIRFEVKAHHQEESDEAGYLLYRADLCPAAIIDAVPTEKRSSIEGKTLTAYTAMRGRRRSTFLCLPPSLCLDDEGPRSLLFLDCFMKPQVVHFFGASTLTVKPTFNALTTPEGLNQNYLIETTPTLKLSSGPILSHSQRLMLCDIATARHIFDAQALTPLTLTDTDIKLQPSPGEPLSASLTLRRSAAGQALSPTAPARTFDATFDSTYL